MSNAAAQQQVDQERVNEMRLLMSEGGDKAVKHKFGEGATNSAEFRLVQRQREAQARRAREQREKVAAEQQAKEHAKARREASTEKAKEEQEAEPDKSKEHEQSTQDGPDATKVTQSAEKAPEKVKVSQRERMIAARQEEKAREPEQSLSR